jgi:hypothetical protein
MSSARITYSQHPDATPEAEPAVLAAIYRFVLFESKAGKRITERVPQATTIEVPKQGKEADMTR